MALFAAVDIPIVHFSVNWWNTLHQGATVLNANLSPTIHGSMAWTLLLGFVALTLAFVWMLLVRYRIGALEDWLAANELDAGPRRAPGGGRDGSATRPPAGRPASGSGRPDAATSSPATSSCSATLALYAVQLVWRRRRLGRAVARVLERPAGPSGGRPVGRRDGPTARVAGR